MTLPRHQYVDPLADSKKHTPKYASTLNKRERITFRILIVAVAVFAVIVTITDVYLADLGHKTQDTVTQGRKDRLNFQHSIQAQANQEKKDLQALACYAANAVPRGKSPFLDGLAKKYSCPPYRQPADTSKPSTRSASSSAVQNQSARSFPVPSPISQGGGAGQTSSPAQPSGGGSSSTPTPSSTNLLCKLLGLTC